MEAGALELFLQRREHSDDLGQKRCVDYGRRGAVNGDADVEGRDSIGTKCNRKMQGVLKKGCTYQLA